MVSVNQVIFSMVLASLGLALSASDVNAARFELLPNFDDQDFDALIDEGTFVEDYRAESRIGADGSRDYELALIEGPSTQPTATIICVYLFRFNAVWRNC